MEDPGGWVLETPSGHPVGGDVELFGVSCVGYKELDVGSIVEQDFGYLGAVVVAFLAILDFMADGVVNEAQGSDGVVGEWSDFGLEVCETFVDDSYLYCVACDAGQVLGRVYIQF